MQEHWPQQMPETASNRVSTVPFRASLAMSYRISIDRFTARVPEMPKYMQEMDLTC
jgi:hypothetical protein